MGDGTSGVSEGKYVVYINWDGFAWYYYQLANQGIVTKTPVINGLIKQGVLFTNIYTGIPSITNPMQSAIVSGAWPATTGNCYKYYDKEKKTVIQFRRENRAENIAEAAVRQGLAIASIHQFIFENRGTKAGDPKRPYIQVGRHTDYKARFNAAIRLIKGKSVGKGSGRVKLDKLPRFISIYMDDLDGIGHNGGFHAARTEAGRLKKVIGRLQHMDRKLSEFIQVCKDIGIYDNMSFILTSDHGMAPFGKQGGKPDDYGCSKLPDLVDSIQKLGYKAEVLAEEKKPKKDTQIVIVTAGLEVQLSFTVEFTEADIERIIEGIKNELYIGQIMKKDEMIRRGACDTFADLLISPKVPYSFKTDLRVYKARGQHDSLDDRAQHIFSIMWGRGIKKDYVYDARIYNIDFARTMAKLLDIEGPRDATGRVLDDALEHGDGSLASLIERDVSKVRQVKVDIP